ncbi:MAG: hypothetical protein ACI8ZM_001774 [Crocinitomix sp.]|jgi:hypothetical protein
MKDSIKYSLKFWLLSVIVAPILISLANSRGEFFILFLVFGFVFSIISWVLITLIIYQLKELKLKMVAKKIIISIFGIILCYIPFHLTFGPTDEDMTQKYIYLYYMIPLVLGIWIFKMKVSAPDNSKLNTTGSQ